MKSLKFLSVTAPIAAGAYFWLNKNGRNVSWSSSIVQASEKRLELEQVQIIFRHGARTPMNYWSKDHFNGLANLKPETWDKDKHMQVLPWTDIDYVVKLQDDRLGTKYPREKRIGPTTDAYRGQVNLKGGCYSGQLTSLGQQQSFDFGKWLSKEYIEKHGFLSPSYEESEIYIRSTYFRRTIQSSVCLIAGLYGKDTLTGPVYIDTKHVEKEDLYCNCIGCRNFIEWFKYILFDEGHSEEEDQLEEAMNQLTGKKDDAEPVNMVALYDLILCRKAHGLFVPEYLLEKEESLKKFTTWLLLHILGKGSQERIKVCIGSFLNNLCSCIEKAVKGNNQTKMFLYCAHDWSLMSLQLAMGLDVEDWPSFGSNIIIELYKDKDGERYVRVLLDGAPLTLDKETAQDFLPIETFMDIMKIVRVLNWDEGCGNSS